MADLAKVSYNDRWEVLKLEIVRLWLDEKVRLKDLVSIMKERYDFSAEEPHYKYRFKQWGIKRSLSKDKKTKIINLLHNSTDFNASTAIIQNGRPIDVRNIRRHAKHLMRATNDLHFQRFSERESFSLLPLPFRKQIFLGWNMPYAALVQTLDVVVNCASPMPSPASPLSDVSMRDVSTVSQTIEHGTVALSQTLTKSKYVQNARLFAHGKQRQLLKSLNVGERKILANWLYQFWLSSFRAAKRWGEHDHGLTSFDTSNFASSPFVSSPIVEDGTRSNLPPQEKEIEKPRQLCEWVLHIDPDGAEIIDSHNNNDDGKTDPQIEPSFEETLASNLALNTFSDIDSKSVPLAITHMAAAVSQSPNEILLEAIGFAIMGRNTFLLDDLLGKAANRQLDLSSVQPLHLAAAYLDGSRMCSLVLTTILSRADTLDTVYVNDLGHTVLDSLFTTILRSHTYMAPGMIDPRFRDDQRLPGDGLDPCGRWDMDSKCYLELLASGQRRVPVDWKHKFCHTSVETICHSIHELNSFGRELRTASGLFQRLCPNCGLRLQLGPIHCFVLVSYHLLIFGLDGEDLFGALSCLLALLHTEKLDPGDRDELSLPLLLDLDPGSGCSHTALSPGELADRLPIHAQRNFTETAMLGWTVFCNVLKHAECTVDDNDNIHARHFGENGSVKSPAPGDTLGYSTCSDVCWDLFTDGDNSLFHDGNVLGHLWAVVQAELLHYRRGSEEEPWTSEEFDMRSILIALDRRTKPDMPLTDDDVMMPYCMHGRFAQYLTPRTGHALIYKQDMLQADQCCGFIVDDY